jgi:predicted RNase H-like HicB family nuclease
MNNSVNYYLNLHHRVTIKKIVESGTNRIYFIGRIPEMPGCIAEGNFTEELLKALKKAKRDWIETCLFLGIEVPIPKDKIKIVQILPSYVPSVEIIKSCRKEKGVLYNFNEEKKAAKERLKQKKNKSIFPDFEKKEED